MAALKFVSSVSDITKSSKEITVDSLAGAEKLHEGIWSGAEVIPFFISFF